MKTRSIFSMLCAASALSIALSMPPARAQDPAQPEPKPQAPAEPKPETPDDAAKYEDAATSSVVGIALPQGAPPPQRVLEKAAVAALSGQLKNLAARANIPLGAPEVLSWSGAQYKRENARDLVAGVTSALKDAGFAYRTLGAPLPAEGSTTTLFTANNDDKKKMLMGYWVEADNMLVLVWAGLQEPDADAFPAQPAK